MDNEEMTIFNHVEKTKLKFRAWTDDGYIYNVAPIDRHNYLYKSDDGSWVQGQGLVEQMLIDGDSKVGQCAVHDRQNSDDTNDESWSWKSRGDVYENDLILNWWQFDGIEHYTAGALVRSEYDLAIKVRQDRVWGDGQAIAGLHCSDLQSRGNIHENADIVKKLLEPNKDYEYSDDVYEWFNYYS